MPAPALPQQEPDALAGTVRYRRVYRDILGRPLRGQVSITGTARTEGDGTVVIPAAVTVDLVSGVLEVDLPPDTYKLVAALRTVEGARVTDSDTVTLAVSPEIDAEHVERINVT